MNEEIKQYIDQTEEIEFDLFGLAKKMWEARKFILKVCGFAALIGLIVAFSIPKEYTTIAKLTPEKSERNSGNLNALASIAGLKFNSSTSPDALSTDIFPEIIKSTPFLTDLFKINVTSTNKEINSSLYDFLLNTYHFPWWQTIIETTSSIPSKIASLFRKEENIKQNSDLYNLSKDERIAIEILNNSINLSIDLKTNIITITVDMQDPQISAQLTDAIIKSLQNYITTYRTSKARNDLDFTLQLFEESKTNYKNAQEKFAIFSDSNHNIYLQSYKIERDHLQNEMDLAYQVYSQVSQQLQMARAKVQENTPVYTVIQPPIVPIRPSKPRKMVILIGFIFLGLAVSMGWVYFKDQLMEWREKIIEPANK